MKPTKSDTEINREEISSYSEDSTKQYLNEVAQIPFLTNDEQTELLEKIAKGDSAAKQKLVKSYLRLVVTIAKYYTNRGIPFLDLVQEGNIGLINAVNKYDISKKTNFTSYVLRGIKIAIKHYIYYIDSSDNIAGYLKERITKYKFAHRHLETKLMREPSIHEIAEYLNFTEEQVKNIIKYSQEQTISLSSHLDDEKNTEIGDFIASDYSLEDDIIYMDLKRIIKDFIKNSNLTPKQEQVLISHYGLNGDEPKSLTEIGNSMGVSRSATSSLHCIGLEKLRKLATKYCLNTFIESHPNIPAAKEKPLEDLFYFFEGQDRNLVIEAVKMLDVKYLIVCERLFGEYFINPIPYRNRESDLITFKTTVINLIEENMVNPTVQNTINERIEIDPKPPTTPYKLSYQIKKKN